MSFSLRKSGRTIHRIIKMTLKETSDLKQWARKCLDFILTLECCFWQITFQLACPLPLKRYFWPLQVACRVLVPPPGTEPSHLQWKHSLNNWTTWEVPSLPLSSSAILASKNNNNTELNGIPPQLFEPLIDDNCQLTI